MARKKEDDFAAHTIDQLGRRSSFICSNPDCRAMTIAPSLSDQTKAIYVGEASHITAASPEGARYDESLTSDQRRSIENGIFLCKVCARKIDVNKGIDFPVELLQEWKAQHEAWVSGNLNKSIESSAVTIDGEHIATGLGEITGLDITGPVTIMPGTIVRAEGEGTVTATRVGNVKK